MTLNIVSDVHYQPDEEYTERGAFTGNFTLCRIDFEPEKLEPADYLLIAGDLATDDIFEKALAKVKNSQSNCKDWGVWNRITMTHGGYSRRRHASPTIAEADIVPAREWIGVERLYFDRPILLRTEEEGKTGTFL